VYVLAGSLQSAHDHSALVAVFASSVGAFMYYVVIYRGRLVPRWLSGWGLAAAPAMMTACLLSLLSDSQVTGYVLLFLPIAVQEMVFAVWLLVKGFNPGPLTSGASSDDAPGISTLSGANRPVDAR
jgi:hypothetical protein